MKTKLFLIILSIQFLKVNNLLSQTVYYDNQTKLYGITNEFGKDILKPTYKEMRVFINGLSKFKQNEKWGLINEKGIIVLPAEFETEYDFSDQGVSEGLLAAKKGGKYGYYNEKGVLIIEHKFDWTSQFCNGMAWIQIGERYSFINKKGEYITNKWFDKIDIIEGISYGIDEKRVYDKDGSYYTQGEPDYYKVSLDGKVIKAENKDELKRKSTGFILPDCNKSETKSQKLFPYKNDKFYGFKDQLGKVIIEAKFYYVFNFSEELALVQTSPTGNYAFINQSGNVAIQINPNWNWINGSNPAFQNGLFEFSYLISKPDDEIQKWEYVLINKKGEIIKKMAEGVFPSWNNG